MEIPTITACNFLFYDKQSVVAFFIVYQDRLKDFRPSTSVKRVIHRQMAVEALLSFKPRTLFSKHSCCFDQASFASKKTAMLSGCHVNCLELTNCRVLSRPMTLVTLNARPSISRKDFTQRMLEQRQRETK